MVSPAERAVGLRRIELHGDRAVDRRDGRVIAATLMTLDNVPIPVVAAWIGHSDAALALRVYAHSQDEALVAAGVALDGTTARK